MTAGALAETAYTLYLRLRLTGEVIPCETLVALSTLLLDAATLKRGMQ